MPAPPILNTFESGQPDTTVITTANSGGDAGTAFNAITASPTFSTTQAHSGTLAMRWDTTATFAQIHADWTGLGSITTSVWFRFYLYLTANFSGSAPRLIGVRTSTPGNSAFLSMSSTGQLNAMNAAQTGLGAGSVAVNLNAWVRIEFRVLSSTTVGEFEWWLYNTPEAPIDSFDETKLHTAQVLGANTDGVQWGPTTVTGPNSWVGFFDDVAVSRQEQIGPGNAPPSLPVDPRSKFIYVRKNK